MPENERDRYYGHTRQEWLALSIAQQLDAMWKSPMPIAPKRKEKKDENQ
tara:strand:- start:34 stop:180 length:147 start_codon:yes stop_codon:yes gene_type:complete